MTKEKVEFKVGEAVKLINRMVKKIIEDQETVGVLKAMVEARNETGQLASTNEALKKEIEKNSKLLAEKEEEFKSVGLKIAGESERLEAKKAEVSEHIKEAEKTQRKSVQDIIDSSRARIDEIELKTKEVIASCEKARKDAEAKALDAVTKKDKAEQELAAFKEKILI